MEQSWKSHLTLSDLELKLPPVHNGFHPITKEKIFHTKAASFSAIDQDTESEIIVVKKTVFSFRFCFVNQYKKASPQLNARVAVILCDNPLTTHPHRWQPPRFVVLPACGVNINIILKKLSWDSGYQKRFTDFNTRKKLRKKIRNVLCPKLYPEDNLFSY